MFDSAILALRVLAGTRGFYYAPTTSHSLAKQGQGEAIHVQSSDTAAETPMRVE